MDLLAALLPSLGVGLLFWYVIRGVLRADRTEREEAARLELQHRAADAAADRARPEAERGP